MNRGALYKVTTRSYLRLHMRICMGVCAMCATGADLTMIHTHEYSGHMKLICTASHYSDVGITHLGLPCVVDRRFLRIYTCGSFLSQTRQDTHTEHADKRKEQSLRRPVSHAHFSLLKSASKADSFFVFEKEGGFPWSIF